MPIQALKISRFMHSIESEDSGYVILYHALGLGLIVVHRSVFKAITAGDLERLDKVTLQQLKKLNLVVTTDTDDDNLLIRAKSFFEKKIIGVLCLMLTDVCNLRCKYCFIEHRFPSNYQFRSLDFKKAKTGIDVFARHLPQSIENGLQDPTISIYGGEPLLNLPILTQVLEYIQRLKSQGLLPENIFITLNTNATLVTPEIAKLLSSHGISASISFDGPPSIHDEARVDLNGRGTYYQVQRGLEILRENNVNIGISCAIAMHNVEILEEVASWFMENLGVDVFGFNILLEGGLPDDRFDIKDYSNKVADKLVRIFQNARVRGKQEERSLRLARAFAEGRIHYYDCSACGQQLVVDPSGRFGPCHAYIHSQNNFIEPDESVDLFSHPLWGKWRLRSPINMPQCQDCIALGLCGGGCPYNAESRFGNMWQPDETFCPFAISLTTFLVKDVANRTLSKLS